jgi:hypothetical protein
MSFENLPGITGIKLDGNLAILPVNQNPVVCVIGTASKGGSEVFYRVDKISDAVGAYGKDGTLVRGLYEASIAGGQNVRLFRIGATAASLANIGESGGLTVTTVSKDDSAGTDFKLFFQATTKRLRVYRASNSELVYDNNPTYPLEAIDTGDVTVTGSIVGSPAADIGSLATPITLAAADGEGDGPATYTAGTDGAPDTYGLGGLSRMKLYENLHLAYDLLSDQDIDVVLPMNAYLDDLNVMDMTAATVSSLSLTSLSDYPAAGDPDDVLGLMYTEEFEGEWYFWWWFPSNPASPSFSSAQIFPTAGSASATAKTDGTALAAADFHEVNFGHQLATFCYQQSQNNEEMTGVIGMLPPAGLSPKLVSQWIGKLPTTTEDGEGNVIVSVNGTGLSGNKFMAGRAALGGLPGYTVNSVSGLYGGGFIATDTGFLDGAQLKDSNEHLVDIGKYLSVVATYPILSNPSRITQYMASGAATYGAFYSSLAPSSAPTNKRLRAVRLPFRVGKAKLDQLAGLRYVTFHAERDGIVVSDAPTAARTDSDYRRLSTVRIVKAVMDDVRAAGRRFLGEGMSGARMAALDTAIDSKLKARVKLQDLTRYEHSVTATPAQRIQGQADVELKLVPAFELRQITVTVALAAV